MRASSASQRSTSPAADSSRGQPVGLAWPAQRLAGAVATDLWLRRGGRNPWSRTEPSCLASA
jgi:hypothetical protein